MGANIIHTKKGFLTYLTQAPKIKIKHKKGMLTQGLYQKTNIKQGPPIDHDCRIGSDPTLWFWDPGTSDSTIDTTYPPPPLVVPEHTSWDSI